MRANVFSLTTIIKLQTELYDFLEIRQTLPKFLRGDGPWDWGNSD